MTVDTLAIARELRAAELPMAQAEAIAAAIGHSISEGSATRGDLAAAKTELAGKIEHAEAKIDAKIESLRSTLILWFIGTGLTSAAIIVAVVKL